jgi:hypothetical protein
LTNIFNKFSRTCDQLQHSWFLIHIMTTYSTIVTLFDLQFDRILFYRTCDPIRYSWFLIHIMTTLRWLFLLKLYIWIPLKRGVLDITLCNKVCQWLTAGWCFSLNTPIFSTNKTYRTDITEILLIVALNAINHPINILYYWNLIRSSIW